MEQIRVEKTASRGIVVEIVYMYLEPDLTPATGTIADDQVQADRLYDIDADRHQYGQVNVVVHPGAD